LVNVISVSAAANITINEGGYIKVGNLVIINLKITATANIAAYTSIISNLPTPLFNGFGLYASTDAGELIAGIYKNPYSSINTSKALESGKIITISGCYLASS
jgi:hypothetical protein